MVVDGSAVVAGFCPHEITIINERKDRVFRKGKLTKFIGLVLG
jgi:hypothetical protein